VLCCAVLFSLSNPRLQWLYPPSLLVVMHRHDVSIRPVSAFIDLLDPLALAIHKGNKEVAEEMRRLRTTLLATNLHTTVYNTCIHAYMHMYMHTELPLYLI